jgi:hypothetical protein
VNVLCVHQNFPGQYLHLARHLGNNPTNKVVFITQRQDAELPGVRKVVYKPRRTISPQIWKTRAGARLLANLFSMALLWVALEQIEW